MTARRADPLIVPIAALALVGIALSAWIAPFLHDNHHVVQGGHIALGAAGALGAVLLLRAEPAWALSLGVGATIFSSHWPLLHAPFAIDRGLIAIGLISLLGRARSLREAIGRDYASPTHWLLLFASLYAVCSAVLAGSISNADARFALLDRFGFVPFVLFVVAPAAFGTEKTRRILLGVLTVTGAYLAYVSILSRIGPDGLVWPHYVVDPSIARQADRARGPFLDGGGNGLALFECAVAAALLAAQQVDRRIRVFAGLVVAACALSIEFTLTRSVWIGSAVALAITLIVAPQLRRWIVPVATMALMVVFGALTVVPGLREEATKRKNDSRSVWDRRNANDAAIRMIKDRPLVGFGWQEFTAHAADYHWINDKNKLTRADLEEHNVFLSNAVELGLIGASLWAFALFAAIGGAIFRRGPPELVPWRIGMVAIAAQFFAVANFVPLGYAFPNAVLWLWAGVTSMRPLPDLEPARPAEPESEPVEPPPFPDMPDPDNVREPDRELVPA